MPSLRNSLNIRSRVMWVRAFFNSYKRRVIAAGGVIQNEPCAVRSLNNNLLRSASWTLIPSGIEEDIVFAQKPTSGLGDLTFTRASDATYTDSTGVVRRSPYNLVTSSSDFSQSYSLLNSTITTNTITDPFGTLLGDSQLETIATDVHAGYNDYTVLVGSQYTFSVYVKSINGRDVRVSGSSGISGPVAVVNLSNGAILSSAGTIQVTNAGNGWYRISITATATTTTARILIYSMVGTQTTFAGDVTKGVYLFGRQLVEGTSALDYFPTTDRQNVPRIDFRNADGTLSSCGRLLLEPQRTNSIRNSSMVGAVAGSPGTLPTNYTSNFRGFSSQVVGTGTENGVPYIDLRLFGTSTGGQVELTLEGNQQMAALVGQTWSLSSYLKIVAGSLPSGSQAGFAITERNSAGASLVEQAYPLTVTSSLQRFTTTRTLNQATTAFVNVRVIVTTSLTPADFTIRIAAPQMELGAYATTWVPTTTAAVTRIADAASKTGVSSLIGQTEGTMFVDLNLDTRQSFSYFLITPNLAAVTNYIGIGLLQNEIRFEVVNSGVQVNINFSNNSVGRFKIAAAYKQNDFVFYVNGVQRGIDTSGTVPACSALTIFSPSSVVQPFQYNQAALFPTRLTNAQLAELTTL